jgi:hypothetical protein
VAGFAAAGSCYPAQSDAWAAWCAAVEPGSTGTSCAGVDSSGVATLHVVVSDQVKTVYVPVSTPPCTVPDPVGDSALFGVAFVALLATVWGARAVYRMFTREVL